MRGFGNLFDKAEIEERKSVLTPAPLKQKYKSMIAS